MNARRSCVLVSLLRRLEGGTSSWSVSGGKRASLRASRRLGLCPVASVPGCTQCLMQSLSGRLLKERRQLQRGPVKGCQFSFFGVPNHFQRPISFLVVSILLMHMACNCNSGLAPWLTNYTQSWLGTKIKAELHRFCNALIFYYWRLVWWKRRQQFDERH